MDLDGYILPQRDLEPRIDLSELMALKTIVRVMAAMLAQGHERASGLSAQSYLNALAEFCVDDLAKADGDGLGDPGLHIARLAAIHHLSAILPGIHSPASKGMN